MSAEAVVTAVRALRYSPPEERNGQTTPGLKTVADEAGISRRTLYIIAENGTCSEANRAALAKALAAVKNRQYKNRRPRPR